MKVRDLRSLLNSADPDEEMFFTQERHDSVRTIDVVPVTRVEKTRYETETLWQAAGLALDDDPDEDIVDEDIETEFLLVIS